MIPLLLPVAMIAQAGEGDVAPLSMEFRRLAVQRFVFNRNLPLCELDPATAVALDLMHPQAWDGPPDAEEQPLCTHGVENGMLVLSHDGEGEARSTMLVGGFNPFAVHDVAIEAMAGTGQIGIDLGRLDEAQRLTVSIAFEGGAAKGVVARYTEKGAMKLEEALDLEAIPAPPFTLRVQMLGTGVAVYTEKSGMCRLLGTLETKPLLDYREKQTFMATKFRLATQLSPGGRVSISSAKAYLSCGVGQADIRLVTNKDGSPHWHDDRLWFLFSGRGWRLPHSTQGVLSLDPTVFDPRYEGMIVFDMGDGKLRNDCAGHVFYDDDAKEWRGWGCNFSTVADGTDRAPSGINYVWSKRCPLRGFSVMQARPAANLEHKHEDPCGFWDEEAGKWRLLLSSFHKCIQASLWEGDSWDGPFERIAGPVPYDSTGTLVQQVGDKRYIFAGSADRAIYVYGYPDMELLGKLKMDVPPWNDNVKNGRVWPNIFPAPEGSPYPHLALTMDRANFPNLDGWNYGALYLYGAVPLGEE